MEEEACIVASRLLRLWAGITNRFPPFLFVRCVDITGIDDHELSGIHIGTAGTVVQSQRGPAIAILHQYAGQLVNDRLLKASGGLQRLKIIDDYVFPIDIINGLSYILMLAYTDSEWKPLPHVIWTSDDN
jgi:hypothetical protein